MTGAGSQEAEHLLGKLLSPPVKLGVVAQLVLVQEVGQLLLHVGEEIHQPLPHFVAARQGVLEGIDFFQKRVSALKTLA